MSRLNNTPQHAPHCLRWVGHLVTFLPALITVLQAYGILTGEQVNAWVALAITVLRVWLQQRATQKPRTDNSPSCSEQRGKRCPPLRTYTARAAPYSTFYLEDFFAFRSVYLF